MSSTFRTGKFPAVLLTALLATVAVRPQGNPFPMDHLSGKVLRLPVIILLIAAGLLIALMLLIFSRL